MMSGGGDLGQVLVSRDEGARAHAEQIWPEVYRRLPRPGLANGPKTLGSLLNRQLGKEMQRRYSLVPGFLGFEAFVVHVAAITLGMEEVGGGQELRTEALVRSLGSFTIELGLASPGDLIEYSVGYMPFIADDDSLGAKELAASRSPRGCLYDGSDYGTIGANEGDVRSFEFAFHTGVPYWRHYLMGMVLKPGWRGW